MDASANSHDLRRLQAKAQQILSQDDNDYFNYVLNEYWQYRNVDGLVLCLLSVLDTPVKLDLLNGVRDIIDEKDVERFDVVAPFKKMANPPVKQATLQRRDQLRSGNASSAGNAVGSTDAGGSMAGSTAGNHREQPVQQLRQVTLNRMSDRQSLGFSICGGREHGMGVYVSTLDPGSLAERSGLRVGDRLLDVNGMNFEHVAHSTAVKVLKSPGRIVLLVRPAKRPAGGSRAAQLRVEETGNKRRSRSSPQISERTGSIGSLPVAATEPQGNGRDSDLDAHASLHALSELRMGGGSIDVRKVNLPVEPGHPLGIAIRGGKEHNVGIFISHVEDRSQAAKHGLQLGDQILDVNGVSFLDIGHADAIMKLKQSPLLMMTVKAMGRIPLAGRSTDGQLKWIEPAGMDPEPEDPSPDVRQSPSLRVSSKPSTPEPSRRPAPTDTSTTPASNSTDSPKKDTMSRRFQDMLRGTNRSQREGNDEDDGASPSKKSSRQRSMTLPSRRSRSLTKADYEDGQTPTRRSRSRSKSQSRDSDEEHDEEEDRENMEKVSTTKRKSVGGLSAALGVGQRLVSSMRKKTNSNDPPPAPALPNNQIKSSPLLSGRRGSAAAPPLLATSPSPKLSRQDGDGSDASDTKPKDLTRPAPPSQITATTATGSGGGGSPFFSRGLGSQVMLTSMAAQASKQAQTVLETSSASCMTEAECGALWLNLKRYEEDQSIVDFTTALLPLLNTSKKVELLRDIRSLINVQHIQQFDELVSKREMEAMMERNKTRPAVGPGAEAKEVKPAPKSPEHGQLFSAIQSGRPQLRKVLSSPGQMEGSPSASSNRPSRTSGGGGGGGGMFQSSAAQKMLERGRSIHEEDVEQRVRRKDSFVAWNDAHEGVRKRGSSKKKHSFATEILVELMKTKSKLGISIEGGVDTKQPEVTISSIIEGGLAAEDGFLQPGFEIKAVDGIAVKGCTHADAVQRISEAFASESDILELLVVPEVD
eukprot:scpid33521/ scgid10693/ Whirlin